MISQVWKVDQKNPEKFHTNQAYTLSEIEQVIVSEHDHSTFVKSLLKRHDSLFHGMSFSKKADTNSTQCSTILSVSTSEMSPFWTKSRTLSPNFLYSCRSTL